MPRFRKRPVVVEAEPYREGLEDDFAHVALGEVSDEILQAWYKDEVLLGAGARAAAGALDAPAPQGPQAPSRRFRLPYIRTEEGPHWIRPTDVIVTGIQDERCPVAKEIFEATYEADPLGALPKEVDEANKHLTKSVQDYYALGRFIQPLRNSLGELTERWEKGERTLAICQEIMAVRVPQS